ncbi:MAG: glycosyltransferase family 4 protein [Betaproteobacteria bacterium]|nr:glycosyltransferase family 4 protein [Betaproteobacteria bacterium]
MKARVCYQINLQESLGGGEIFTRFLTAALHGLGWQSKLFVSPRASFWRKLGLDAAGLVAVRTLGEIEAQLDDPETKALVVTHSVLPPEEAKRFALRSLLTGFIHMPLYERFPEGLRHYRLLFGVSEHVIASARSRGLANVYPEPLYGIADLAPRGMAGGGICAASPYDWDRRKLRDRLLGIFAPLASSLAPQHAFAKRPGLTLGIVSRITPIKQFPALFAVLAPVLARFPRLNLEIFGSGGYASVRDLKAALAPIEGQVRFWGQQDDVAAIYPQLDYVLSGLPEKEALGLNLIEAQCCGTPVLAVKAPPFTETVIEGETGFFFDDPRSDRGAGFGALIERLLAGRARPRPALARAHLEKFSASAFSARIGLAIEAALA